MAGQRDRWTSVESPRVDLGTNVTAFKKRSVEDCLNCERPKCNGCPIGDKWEPDQKGSTKHDNETTEKPADA